MHKKQKVGHRIATTDLRHRQTHTGLDTDYVNHNIMIRIFKWTPGHPTTTYLQDIG